jgi:hypothetical protein
MIGVGVAQPVRHFVHVQHPLQQEQPNVLQPEALQVPEHRDAKQQLEPFLELKFVQAELGAELGQAELLQEVLVEPGLEGVKLLYIPPRCRGWPLPAGSTCRCCCTCSRCRTSSSVALASRKSRRVWPVSEQRFRSPMA